MDWQPCFHHVCELEVKGCTEINVPYSFLSAYLCPNHENYTIPCFSTMSLSTSMALCQRASVCKCLVSTMPCPAHVVMFSLCESHFLQSHPLYNALHPSGLYTSVNLMAVERMALTPSNQILWWLPEFSNLCMALHCHAEARFQPDSCEAKLIWNTSEFFNVWTSELTVFPLGISSTRITPPQSQKTVMITLPADREFFLIFSSREI
jgi:hypothetical protein